MKKLARIIYPIRIILFIMHLLMLYMVVGPLTYIKLGYLFIIIDILLVIKTIIELLSQQKYYKHDIYYNIMQIGLYAYIGVLWYRLTFTNVVLGSDFILYLKNNFIILSILIVFLIFYSTSLINKIKFK